MRQVDRTRVAAPAILTDPNAAGLLELKEARKHYARRPADPKRRKKFKAYEFAAYKDKQVKAALRQLFFGKCAYCETYFESAEPVDIEHYRPKGAVSGCPDHPGYWWLAMDWTNLLPSCIDCNRKRGQTAATERMTMADLERLLSQEEADDSSGKKDTFPTADNKWVSAEGPTDSEKPLLIDPTRDNPVNHLRWPTDPNVQVSVVLPTDQNGKQDPRGVWSIGVYGLNRLGLVQERTRLLNKMRVERSKIFRFLEMAKTTTDAQTARGLEQMAVDGARGLRDWCESKEPYSAMVNVFVDELDRDLRAALKLRP